MNNFIETVPLFVLLIIMNRATHYWCSKYEEERETILISEHDWRIRHASYLMSKIGYITTIVLLVAAVLISVFKAIVD